MFRNLLIVSLQAGLALGKPGFVAFGQLGVKVDTFAPSSTEDTYCSAVPLSIPPGFGSLSVYDEHYAGVCGMCANVTIGDKFKLVKIVDKFSTGTFTTKIRLDQASYEQLNLTPESRVNYKKLACPGAFELRTLDSKDGQITVVVLNSPYPIVKAYSDYIKGQTYEPCSKNTFTIRANKDLPKFRLVDKYDDTYSIDYTTAKDGTIFDDKLDPLKKADHETYASTSQRSRASQVDSDGKNCDFRSIQDVTEDAKKEFFENY